MNMLYSSISLLLLSFHIHAMDHNNNSYEIAKTDENKRILIAGKTYHAKNFCSREDHQPNILVLHYTAGSGIAGSAFTLTEGPAGVSAHYLVPDQETLPIYQLVNEEDCASHAGVSQWRRESVPHTRSGNPTLNYTSLGIEILNFGYERTRNEKGEEVQILDARGNLQFRPFPAEQIKRVMYLSKLLKDKYNLKPWNITGHSDIAIWHDREARELRKVDPGAAFDWQSLAEHEVSMWPNLQGKIQDFERPMGLNIIWLKKALERVGYYITNKEDKLDDTTLMSLNAFRLHYQPKAFVYKYPTIVNWDGDEAKETQEILYNLITQYAIPPVKESIFDKEDYNK